MFYCSKNEMDIKNMEKTEAIRTLKEELKKGELSVKNEKWIDIDEVESILNLNN